MRKKAIFFIAIVLIIIVNLFYTNKSRAIDITEIEKIATTQDTVINPSDYDPGDINSNDAKSFNNKVGKVLGAIRNISVAASVIVLMVIGVKYMLGSVEEKANYKQTLLPYIIGCVMAVAGTTLVSFIYNAVN